jgi:hypothetical protein
MASAEVALGEHERAFERQATVRKEMDQQAVVFDSYIRMLSNLFLTSSNTADTEMVSSCIQVAPNA